MAAIADDSCKDSFFNYQVRILIPIALKFVPIGPVDNNLHWFR